MAIQGQIPIEFGMVFPAGAYAAGGIEMVRDFDRSSGDRVVQQADKHTGLPLWVVEVIDAAGGRPAADGQGQDRRAGPAGAAVPGARVAVHRGGVRRHDRHPLRGRVPLLGRRQEQVRRPAGVLVQGHGRAGSLAGDRPPGA